MIKDILASSRFWCFILQYSRAMGQRDTDGGSKDLGNESDDEEPLQTRNTQDGYEV